MRVIFLDGKIDSPLEWKLPQELEGPLFWQIDLGLFSELNHPLENPMQLGALALALKYFKERFFERFEEQTCGLSFFRGPLSLEERDRAIDYLELLAEPLPPGLPLFALVDLAGVKEPLEAALLLEGEAWGRVRPAANRSFFRTKYSWSCEAFFFNEWEGVVEGVVLPSPGSCSKERLSPLGGVLSELGERCRILSEAQLTAEWEGLDRLYVQGDLVTPFLKRRLRGFCAAGGEVVRLGGEPLGLPLERAYGSGCR